MNPPDLQGIADAWRRANDADVASALADLTAYEPAAVALIQDEAARRGVDATIPVDDALVRRSLYLGFASASFRFFLRHRMIIAILVGIAYQQANTVVRPILQPYARTTAEAIAINVASILV